MVEQCTASIITSAGLMIIVLCERLNSFTLGSSEIVRIFILGSFSSSSVMYANS